MRNYPNDLAIPSAYVYQRKSGPGTGWWVKCTGDIIAFGPFPSAADAVHAWRQALCRIEADLPLGERPIEAR